MKLLFYWAEIFVHRSWIWVSCRQYLPKLKGLNTVSKFTFGKGMQRKEKTTLPSPAQNINVCVDTLLHFTGITLHIAPKISIEQKYFKDVDIFVCIFYFYIVTIKMIYKATCCRKGKCQPYSNPVRACKFCFIIAYCVFIVWQKKAVVCGDGSCRGLQ